MFHARVLRSFTAAAAVIVLAGASIAASAQQTEANGIIKTRSGEQLTLQNKDNTETTVVLTDSTDVGQAQGMLKKRSKAMSFASLIPGLPIKVKGVLNDQNQLVAQTIRFSGDDLKQANAIQAGMHETNQQVAANQQELTKQNAAIQEAVARFGQLDDYYILDEVTILFANGKTNVEQQYVPQLQALAQKAQNVQGYMIEIKGYASAVGNAAKNQELSEKRADNVSTILIQQCKIPLTRMLAPGAMGVTEQVGDNQTKEGQEQNRRVVVRVLQNKAIAGTAAKTS
ncbi:OmpA family protein [Occallatibacter riparius]|uniref:OmpA family protein n=1 Tax=Occallatibacter riparius TaxID=1002689 RepID=A0A9J7BPN1_9BACT|nr:OmpA family protein [Occallatibacter riparius]UWZ84844.1 OmpA family protein [Occallatibacter riparius]